MEGPRTPDDALLQAYRATCYHVSAPGNALQLRVGQYDAGLAKLLREAWVDSAALITAWNPDSELRDRSVNEAAQRALVQQLSAAGHPCLAGRNVPDDKSTDARTWIEDSVLVLEVTLEAAREIAARCGQLAFLWIDRRAVPQLVMTAARPD
jgi:hypothetical protein